MVRFILGDKMAHVSGQTMNVVYDLFREMSPEELSLAWDRADPMTPDGALIRHQLFVTVERLVSGRWVADTH